ncbi:MAG: ABC transporter ATP-binding protein [Coriobacteriia bacterium]|nr:ABC transporter ATP-binding protein [Coriobacteriia bacterium]
MIRVNGLVKEFGDIRALDALDLHVPAGAVYGLVGPNGAGKTTALQHIAGVYRPTAGEVLVNGQPVYENPQVKATIAYIPTDFFFYQQARVQDMCDLHAALFPRFDRQRFGRLAAAFALDKTRAVRSLSKGMQKQLAFWLALSERPDVLLLDEPLDGLDPAARRQVLSVVMDEVAERGMTVLVSSHNLRELTDVCDHVGIVDAGRMRLERSLEELQDNFVKAQVAFADEGQALPATLDIVNSSVQGKLHTLVLRGSSAQVEQELSAAGATFVNILPLSLEEIFIYEIGGAQHANGILA